jgi:hypothetical protein
MVRRRAYRGAAVAAGVLAIALPVGVPDVLPPRAQTPV